MKIVVTGAAGNMGSKLAEHLGRTAQHELVLLDRPEAATGAVVGADLTQYDLSWASTFAKADAVVHFAADRSPTSGWETILPLNVDLLINVYEAARAYEAKRIIFASSNWVMGGYRFRGDRISTTLQPLPVNPYGAAKLFGERLGKALSDHEGISVINLRIGYNQWLRGNLPGPAMELGAWGQQLWLSDRDFLQVMDRAIVARDIPYATLNVTSNITGGRWDLSETTRVLGYKPQDTYTVRMPLYRKLTGAMAWLRDVGGEGVRRLFSEDW